MCRPTPALATRAVAGVSLLDQSDSVGSLLLGGFAEPGADWSPTPKERARRRCTRKLWAR
jgi:hypothetical protein